MSLRLAVFDCDGTLVDSHADICAAMDLAFAGGGLTPPAHAETRRIVGLSLPEAMRRLHPAGGAEHAALCDRYKAAFRERRASGNLGQPLFEGIADLLTELDARGWLIGVATGMSDRGLDHCLAQHGIAGYFVTRQTADRHPSKPHPAMLEAALAEAGADADEAVMIGDTAFDMAMAGAAGVRAIGVAWGYHGVDDLLSAGAEAVAEDTAELLALVERPA